MGTHQATGRRLSPSTSHPSPLAQRAFCRQILKVRTVCLNWARTDLCGGRGVIPVSTAIRAAGFLPVRLSTRLREGTGAVARGVKRSETTRATAGDGPNAGTLLN